MARPIASPSARRAPGYNFGLLADLARKMAEAGVREAHPQAPDREVFLRVALRHLPRELMIRAYGWDPEINGNAG